LERKIFLFWVEDRTVVGADDYLGTNNISLNIALFPTYFFPPHSLFNYSYPEITYLLGTPYPTTFLAETAPG
jgi:hypothetical protein